MSHAAASHGARGAQETAIIPKYTMVHSTLYCGYSQPRALRNGTIKKYVTEIGRLGRKK